MHLIANSHWKEKNESFEQVVVRHVSGLLVDLRTVLVPRAAYLSPTWSHSMLTMHNPVTLAQGFASDT